jgi:Xaa-Pro aminopeptidase
MTDELHPDRGIDPQAGAVGPDLDSLLATVRRKRTERATGLMRKLQVDTLLLGMPDDIRYVCDYRSLIINESADWMLCVFDDTGQADIYGAHVREEAQQPHADLPAVRSLRPLPSWVPVMAEPETVVRTIAGALNSARRVGYDAIHPELLRSLKSALPRVEFEYAGHAIFETRQRKLPEEVALMERACADNARALDAAWAVAVPGASDYDLLAASIGQQQRQGAEIITHYTCNVRADNGVWFPTGKRIQPGDGVFIDQVYYGAGGYASDLTRTVFVGEPAPEVLRAYADLVEVSRAVHAAARPGVSISQLDKMLNDSLVKCGLAPSPYGLGHGIGLRVCELPSLTQRDLLDRDSVLVEGQVIAIEPETSVLHAGREHALKVEDCFVVEADGIRPLGPPAGVHGVVLDG